jgi:DNA-binding response OmpR family regulator
MISTIIVDDEEYIRKIIKKLLNKENIVTFEASNYDEFIKIFNDINLEGKIVDSIFLDYTLKEDESERIIEYLLSINNRPKICLMSGLPTDEIKNGIYFDYYIYKPDLNRSVEIILKNFEDKENENNKSNEYGKS